MYDEALADRIRRLVAGEEGISEKKMFGGLAFLLNGNMAVSASGQGGALVRIHPEETEAAIGEADVERMEMGGRNMDGWVRVAPEALGSDEALVAWVGRGVAYAKTLPPK